MDQVHIDRMLKWGIVFSILWLAGLGSIFAFMSGLKARKAINASNGTMVGTGRAWWCIAVGALGFAFWLPIILIGVYNQF